MHGLLNNLNAIKSRETAQRKNPTKLEMERIKKVIKISDGKKKRDEVFKAVGEQETPPVQSNTIECIWSTHATEKQKAQANFPEVGNLKRSKNKEKFSEIIKKKLTEVLKDLCNITVSKDLKKIEGTCDDKSFADIKILAFDLAKEEAERKGIETPKCTREDNKLDRVKKAYFPKSTPPNHEEKIKRWKSLGKKFTAKNKNSWIRRKI